MAQRDQICMTCWFRDPDTSCPKDTAIPAVTEKRKACRRYPTIEWKAAHEWCGEWASLSSLANSEK